MELYDFQNTAIDQVRTKFAQGKKKVILSLPTGAGKTVCAMYMVKKALDRGKKVAFVMDRLSLLDQTAKYMSESGIDFGIIQGDHIMTDYVKQFQICSAQTLAKRNHVNDFDFMIIDEIQVMYKHQLNILKNANGTYFLGLSATPWATGLGKYWDDLVVGPNTNQMIQDGFLSKYIAFGPSSPDLKGVRTSAGDYNKKDLADRTNKKELIGDILKHWLKLALNRCTVVMAVNVAHATQIKEIFKEAGVFADVIHCYLDRGEAQKRLQMFRDGKTQVLCSVDMVSRGFNMPQADCLVMARPTKSLIYHIQAIGRILRSVPGKENALILDHASNIERLGFPDDDFEMILDMGIKKQNKKKDKKERLPKPCPKCSFLTLERKCPNCGFEKKRQSNVETKEGELKELQKKRHKITTPENKEKLYAKLLAGAKAAEFKEGWSAHQYRNYFGVWPKKHIEIDHRFYDFLITQPRHKVLRIIFGLAKKN